VKCSGKAASQTVRELIESANNHEANVAVRRGVAKVSA